VLRDFHRLFGAQYVLYGRFEGGLPLVPPWRPGAPVLAYVLGVALVLAALSIASLWKRDSPRFPWALSYFCLSSFCTAFTSRRLSTMALTATRAFECLTLSAIGFSLAGILPDGRNSSASGIATNWPLTLGRSLFAISMVVFGAQHFMYAGFIATLIPAWIPLHLFLGLSHGHRHDRRRLLHRHRYTGVLGLNGPRHHVPALVSSAARAPCRRQSRNGDEWTSAFVALAVSGGSFLLASTFSRRPSI